MAKARAREATSARAKTNPAAHDAMEWRGERRRKKEKQPMVRNSDSRHRNNRVSGKVDKVWPCSKSKIIKKSPAESSGWKLSVQANNKLI